MPSMLNKTLQQAFLVLGIGIVLLAGPWWAIALAKLVLTILLIEVAFKVILGKELTK